MQKPSIAELLAASGHTIYTPELVQRGMFALYGHIGANLDERNWAGILQSGYPLEAAEAGLRAMYQSGGYLLRNVQHLERSGYEAAQAEITYRQLADRLGFTHQSDWSAGTPYAGLGQLSMDQLVAMVAVPSTDKIVTVAAGGTYNGSAGIQDDFQASISDLSGTTIAGNAADADALTLTTAGTVTINNGGTGGSISNIKVLNLANGTNTITDATSAGFTTVRGGTGDDTFIANTAWVPVAVVGGDGADTLVLTADYAATASGSSSFASNVTGFEKLRLTTVTNQTIDLQALGNYNDVTFSGANGLTLVNMSSNGNVTLTGTGRAMTLSNAVFAGGSNDTINLNLIDDSTAAVAFASTGITASDVETVNISVNDTQATPAGAVNDTLTWLGNSVKTINVSGNGGLTLTAASTALTTVDASGITLGGFTLVSGALAGTATVKGSATGANTVRMGSAMAGVNYTGGSGTDNVTINATVSSTAALGNGNNNLTLTGDTILGTYTAGSGSDKLTISASKSDLSNATITGFENLTLSKGATITATIAQLSQFTESIIANGPTTLNLTTAGTVNAVSAFEIYNLANGANDFTSVNIDVSVTGGTDADVFNFTANQIINNLTDLDGGNGTDTLNIGATTTLNMDLSTRVSGIEIINVAGSTGIASFTNVGGAGVTLNYTKLVGNNTITLGSGGQTLNLLGSSSASTTITGGAATDVIQLQSAGSGSETLVETGANMSNRTQIDVVGNFNATGTDYFKTGVNATAFTNYTIGAVDVGDLLSTITGLLGGLLNNAGQACLITVPAGTAAGTYLFQNTGGDAAVFDDTDFFVQLTGTVGTIGANNLIA